MSRKKIHMVLPAHFSLDENKKSIRYCLAEAPNHFEKKLILFHTSALSALFDQVSVKIVKSPAFRLAACFKRIKAAAAIVGVPARVRSAEQHILIRIVGNMRVKPALHTRNHCNAATLYNMLRRVGKHADKQ